MKYSLAGTLFFLPLVSFAQSTGSVQGLIAGTIGFINEILIPFVLGIAFLFFVINAVRFFIVGGSSDEGKENAKSLAIYSIGTFVFILAFWGLINVIASGIGLVEQPCIDGTSLQPDYIDSIAPCSSIRPKARPNPTTPNKNPYSIPVPNSVDPKNNPYPIPVPNSVQ